MADFDGATPAGGAPQAVGPDRSTLLPRTGATKECGCPTGWRQSIWPFLKVRTLYVEWPGPPVHRRLRHGQAWRNHRRASPCRELGDDEKPRPTRGRAGCGSALRRRSWRRTRCGCSLRALGEAAANGRPPRDRRGLEGEDEPMTRRPITSPTASAVGPAATASRPTASPTAWAYLWIQPPCSASSSVDVAKRTGQCFDNLFGVEAAGLGPEHVVKVNAHRHAGRLRCDEPWYAARFVRFRRNTLAWHRCRSLQHRDRAGRSAGLSYGFLPCRVVGYAHQGDCRRPPWLCRRTGKASSKLFVVAASSVCGTVASKPSSSPAFAAWPAGTRRHGPGGAGVAVIGSCWTEELSAPRQPSDPACGPGTVRGHWRRARGERPAAGPPASAS